MRNSNSEVRFQRDRSGGLILFNTQPGNTFFFFLSFSPPPPKKNYLVVIETSKLLGYTKNLRVLQVIG